MSQKEVPFPFSPPLTHRNAFPFQLSLFSFCESHFRIRSIKDQLEMLGSELPTTPSTFLLLLPAPQWAGLLIIVPLERMARIHFCLSQSLLTTYSVLLQAPDVDEDGGKNGPGVANEVEGMVAVS